MDIGSPKRPDPSLRQQYVVVLTQEVSLILSDELPTNFWVLLSRLPGIQIKQYWVSRVGTVVTGTIWMEYLTQGNVYAIKARARRMYYYLSLRYASRIDH